MVSRNQSPPFSESEQGRAVNRTWSKKAEVRFSEGMFVIVPDLEGNAPIDEAKVWQAMAIKEDKIRVLKPDCKELSGIIELKKYFLWVGFSVHHPLRGNII